MREQEVHIVWRECRRQHKSLVGATRYPQREKCPGLARGGGRTDAGTAMDRLENSDARKRLPSTLDEIRFRIAAISDQLDEWITILGEPKEGTTSGVCAGLE